MHSPTRSSSTWSNKFPIVQMITVELMEMSLLVNYHHSTVGLSREEMGRIRHPRTLIHMTSESEIIENKYVLDEAWYTKMNSLSVNKLELGRCGPTLYPCGRPCSSYRL